MARLSSGLKKLETVMTEKKRRNVADFRKSVGYIGDGQ